MYEEHFGLAKKPFQLSPDAKFFFPSAEHAKALSFLQYGLGQGDGFIVITGNIGTGKTMLAQALVNDLDESEFSVATIVTSNLQDSDLLQMLVNHLGIEVARRNKAALLKGLEHYFVQELQAHRRTLLIIDEAQNLPQASLEELRMLSNFQQDGRPLVQIFLLGQQEFRQTLLSDGFEQLRQRVIATYHLNPLGEEETRTYIRHRMQIAGWQGKPEFTRGAYSEIYRFCEGVPRRINNICDRLLLFAYLEELTVIDDASVCTVAEEIGSEFWGSQSETASGTNEMPAAAEVFDTPAPLGSMAKSMLDKAELQKRIATLDGLDHNLKPELTEIREELSYLRLMLDDILHEVRGLSTASRPSLEKKQA